MTGAAAEAAAPPAEAGRALAGTLLIATAACLFGSISTLVVFATRPGVALETVLFWRYLLASLVLVPLGWRAAAGLRRDGSGPLTGARLAPTLLVAGGGQAAVALLSLSALRWISVGTLGFLFYTYPAWVTLVAAVRGTERLDRRRLAALGLSFAGIACTVGLPGAAPSGTSPWPGVGLALAAAVVYALYVPFLGTLQERTSPMVASAAVAGSAAALFGAGALVVRGPAALVAVPPAAWWAIGALALPCTVLAFLLFMRGIDRLGPVRTAIVSTVEPLFTAVLGAVALGQALRAPTLVGGALIAGAVALLQLRPRPRR